MSYGRIPLARIERGSVYPAWYFDCIDDADLPYRFGDDAIVVAEIKTSLGAVVYRYSTVNGTASASGQRVSFAPIDPSETSAMFPGTHGISVQVTTADGYVRTFMSPRKFSVSVAGGF